MTVKVDLFDPKGEKATEIVSWLDLKNTAKPGLIAQVVRVFLGNQRAGLAKAKTRGQVSGTTKKIYKQKGTGGARHGSRKAPVFVGGGKAHGPDGRQNYSGKTNKQSVILAFMSALSDKQKSGRLALTDYPEFSKTGQAGRYFGKIITALESRSPILIVDIKNEKNCQQYCRNLSTLSVKDVGAVNTYEIIRADAVLISHRCLPELKKRGGIK